MKSEIVSDINYMHFCKNINEFEIAKFNIYKKWDNNGLVELKNYFETQWETNEKFNK